MKLLPPVMLLAVLVPAARAATPEENLAALGLTLPAVPPAAANYLPPVHTGNRLFLTGQISRDPEGKGAPVKVELVAEIEMER